MTLPARLKSARLARALSQREAAGEFGVHPNTYARWERGELEMSGPSKKLAEVFIAKGEDDE